MREAAEDGVADAAFLAGLLAGKFSRDRRLIIERVAFGQRTFGEVADADMQDVFVALRAYGRFPAAMLALERIGIRKPALFALAARRAAALEADRSGDRRAVARAVPGSLALLERLARTGAIPPPRLEPLVTSLLAVTLDDDRYRGGVAGWLRTQLIPALPAARAVRATEERLLDALRRSRRARGAVLLGRPGLRPGHGTAAARAERAAREAERATRSTACSRSMRTSTRLAATSLTLDAREVPRHGAAHRCRETVWRAPLARCAGRRPGVGKVVERVVKDLNGIRNPVRRQQGQHASVRPLVDALDYLLGETLVALAYAGVTGRYGTRRQRPLSTSRTATSSDRPQSQRWPSPGCMAAADARFVRLVPATP